ncbi:MAG: PEGA domain-containing protein, partial [Candidatus Electryoneaceae bacterium]|nr:PEGA domain-containing protein [Candidatus Electryoneaceae bacterium]
MRSLHHVREVVLLSLLVCLLILTVVSLGYGLQKPVAVVFPLKSDGVSTTTSGLITERISELLGQSRRIRVLNRDDIMRIDETVAVNMGDCTEEGCGIQMGQQLDADKVIIGSISRVGERVTIIANYIDCGTTERKTSSVDIDKVPEEQLVDYIPGLIAKILMDIPLLQAKIVNIDGRDIYIDAGLGLLEAGQLLQVRRRGERILDGRDRIIGHNETDIGKIEVVRLQGQSLAKCKVISGSGFQVGDFTEIPSNVQQQEVIAIPTVPSGTSTTTSPTPTRPGTAAIRRGGLAVNSDPVGATVTLGGEELGVTPLRRDGLEVGDRILLIHMEGHVDNTQMVTISPGRTASATARLVRMCGTLIVKTDPIGAWITLNGEDRGETDGNGLELPRLVVGSYTVRADLEHYHPAERTVAVRYNACDEVNLTLSPKPGAIYVSSTPSGAEIWIDNVLQRGKVTPVKITSVDPGSHTVRVRKGGYTVPDTTITVPPEQTVTITRDLASQVIEEPTPIHIPETETVNISTSFFSRDSHKYDVLRIQGTPNDINIYASLGYEIWSYGLSTVIISTQTNRVIEWNNTAHNLKVRQQPATTTSTKLTNAVFFTRGSHKDDVLRLQGTPNDINIYEALGYETWYYEYSSIKISTQTNRVIEWDNASHTLKVRLLPGHNVTRASFFTRGSHKDDVIRLQGTPNDINIYEALGYETWYYEYSSIKISTQTNRVIEWDNASHNLKVRLLPGGDR